jgi:hypothetical protein
MSFALQARSPLPKRYFTLLEAQSALARIRSQFEIAVIYNRRLDNAVTEMSASRGQGESRRRAARIRDDLDRVLNIVREVGAEVANLSPGTLDFPALRNGEPVYISWRTGDATVSWWRPVNSSCPNHRKLGLADHICWEWRN